MLSPDPRRSSPPSGRKSTYPTVQIPQATSKYTVQQLKNAERPSPELYGQARDFFDKILEGNFSFEFALSQLRTIPDAVERKCAEDVLRASKHFLIAQTPAPVGKLPRMWFELPNGLRMPVSSVRIRQFQEPRLMVLYLWKKPLSSWQLSAVAAILQSCLDRVQPHLSFSRIEFISVAEEGNPSQRRLHSYNWEALQPLSEDGLQHFLQRFCKAWRIYQSLPPRERKRREGNQLRLRLPSPD
jgi:hypothetical protein